MTIATRENPSSDSGPRFTGCQAADFSANESLHVELAYQYLLKTRATVC